ncbi:MAG TPA: DUF6441 family protein [Brevundimonas sp.]|nr:DUF6441 family protein [Brevundimonas sp.]
MSLTVDGREGDVALALQGRLQETIDAELRDLYGAYWRAMNRVVEAGKGRLRDDIARGGFHNAAALSKTWRGNVYPSSKNSLEVAGWIYTRAGMIIDVFETATVIKVRGNAQFLAIPLGPAKAIVRRLQQQKRKGLIGRNAWGRFEKDDSYVEQVARTLGVDLQPVIAADRQTGVLIPASKLTLTPTGRQAKNQARAATPLFALAKVATLNKRIRGRALLAEIMNNFPSDFVHALTGEMAGSKRSDGR